MTRQEYLDQLAQALDFLEEDARTAAMLFYAEMLDDRMEDGMDEASAVAAMEAPRDIAARLRAENEGGREEKKPGGLRDEALEFSSLVNSIVRGAGNLVKGIDFDAIGDAAQSAGKRAKEISGDALKKASDAMEKAKEDMEKAAEDMKKAQQEMEDAADETGNYEKKVLTCSVSGLQSVRLLAANKPIVVSPAPGDQAQLVYYTSESDPYTAGVEQGVLVLRGGQAGQARGNIFISGIFRNIQMIWNRSAPAIHLFLPPDALLSLQAETSNSSIQMEGMNCLCETNLKTTNSRISLENIRCKSLEARTGNGRIVLDRVQSKSFIRCKTGNSRITFSQVKSEGELSAITSNGRILAENTISLGAAEFITSNGSVTVEHISVPALKITTSNGSIQGTLPGCRADWQITSGTSNGSNSLPRFQEGKKPLEARTSNGSIRLGFEEE